MPAAGAALASSPLLTWNQLTSCWSAPAWRLPLRRPPWLRSWPAPGRTCPGASSPWGSLPCCWCPPPTPVWIYPLRSAELCGVDTYIPARDGRDLQRCRSYTVQEALSWLWCFTRRRTSVYPRRISKRRNRRVHFSCLASSAIAPYLSALKRDPVGAFSLFAHMSYVFTFRGSSSIQPHPTHKEPFFK